MVNKRKREIIVKTEQLKNCIKSKYGSELAMAKAMNWPRQRLNKITNGKKEPDVSEVAEIASALDLSITVVAEFFLT